MTARTISSVQTFWIKYVIPPIWILGFGLGTLGLFLGAFSGRQAAPPPPWMKWLLLAVWILGTLFIGWSCARLKKVRMDGVNLYVSNYVKEIQVPWTAIRDVTENRWLNIHPVTIHFRQKTAFGDRIVFMPAMRLFNWKPHPVVAELRKLAGSQAAIPERR